MRLKKVIEEIIQNNIEAIVSIDDAWGASTEERDDLNNDIRSEIERKGLDLSEWEMLLEELNIDLVKDLLENTNVTEEFKENLEELKKEFSITRDKKEALKNIKDLFEKVKEKDETIEWVEISKISEIATLLPKKRNLIFIDREMEGQGTDSILDTIRETKKNNPTNLNIYIIYSHTSLEEFSTHVQRMDYLERKNRGKGIFEVYDNLYLLYGVEKGLNFNEFLKGILGVIKEATLGGSIQNILNHKIEVETNAYKELYTIELNNLDNMLEDALFEGESPIEIIRKLVKGLKKNKAQSMLIENKGKYEDYSEIIQNKLKQKKSELDSNKKFEDARKKSTEAKVQQAITGDERMLTSIFDYKVNKLFLDISKGDLFEINDDKIGVVISRECDCVIRHNSAKNINRKLNKFQILLLKKSILKIGQPFEEYHGSIWPIKINGENTLLKATSKTMEIDSEILDLCTLNKNGESKLENDSTYKKLKSYHSKEYFNDFLTKWKDKISLDEITEILGEITQHDDLKYILMSRKNEIKLDKNGDDIVGFKFKRIGRLQNQRTLFLLQEYNNAFLKPGLDVLPMYE